MRFCEVAELLAYCLEREALEEGGPLHFPVEVVEVLSHLGIYHHNFEHYRHGLVLLQLAEGLIAALDARAAGGGGLGVGGSAAQVNSARTHVMFYLAQVRVILGWPFGPVSYPKAAVNLCTNLLGPGYLSLSQGFDPTALYSPPPL
jgi:hypothetical protein